MSGDPELIHADPGTLRTTANVRTDLRITPEFIDSIATMGVQVPIVAVRGADGGLDIEHGHRRAAAAVAAGLDRVPVMVVPERAPGPGRLLSQVAENHARAPLNPAELVAAHEQLALLGVPISEAARATGSTQAQVTAARFVAAAPTTRTRHLAGLDLEQAAALAEFDDDPGLLENLAQVAVEASPDDFRRAVQQARDEKATTAALQVEAQAWRERGYAVTVQTGWGPPEPGRWQLWKLLTPDGADIEPADHTECPGRAVTIAPSWRAEASPKVTHQCINPEEHGHRLPAEPVVRSDHPNKAAAAAQRATVIEANKAWRAAESVRREHVRNWLTTAKPTAATTRWLLGELIAFGVSCQRPKLDQLRELGWSSDVLRPGTEPQGNPTGILAGQPLRVSPNASGPRAQMATLALVLADRELATGVHSWRHPSPTSPTARYLAFLVEHTGYTLGPVEAAAAGRSPLPEPAIEGTAVVEVSPEEAGEVTQDEDPLATDPLAPAEEGTERPAAAAALGR